MANIETILVVGGGVAGLTMAAALHRHGFTTELVEQQQTWHALGAGFLVQANGMRMLLALGLAAGVENAGAVVRRWQFCDEHGDLLSETDLEALWERPRIKKAIMGSSKTAAAMNQKRAPAVGQVPGSRRHPVVTDTGGCQLYGQGLGLANAHPSRQL